MKKSIFSIHKYCTCCGSPNVLRKPSHSVIVCKKCNASLYINSKPSVAAVISRDNELLLVKDTSIYWDFPGGFLLNGETPMKGLRRELQEELSASISIKNLIAVFVDKYGTHTEFSLNLFFQCKLLSKIVVPKGEIMEYKWFKLQALPRLKYNSTRAVAKLASNGFKKECKF